MRRMATTAPAGCFFTVFTHLSALRRDERGARCCDVRAVQLWRAGESKPATQGNNYEFRAGPARE